MSVYLFCVIACLPLIWLAVALVRLRKPGYIACPIALIITFLLAALVWKMPLLDAVTAGIEGFALALWPILIVIIAAVFTYNLSIHTKSMDVIIRMLTGITTDKRILVLIIAWGFGGFLEGITGFGTAVVIPLSILVVLGFEPVFAAIICLLANTTPTTFGAMGIPVTTLAKVTNLDIGPLCYAVGWQLFPLIVIVPFVLVMLTGKSIKAVKGVFFITLASGLSFAVFQLLAARFWGAELPAILGGVCSMAVTIILAKALYKEKTPAVAKRINLNEGLKAWSPFILVFVFILLTSPIFPLINEALVKISTSVNIYTGEGAGLSKFTWLATPGMLIIIATFIGGLIQGAKLKEIFAVLLKTFRQMWRTVVTVLAIVALAKIMGYSGMIKSIAVVLVMMTGASYPLIAPVIGALGTFVTGSDTNANVLLGGLQVEVAKSLGLNPYWLAAANTAGATAGKMISPQSIAVACAAVIGLAGEEGNILKATVKACAFYVIILGLMAYFTAAVFGF